MKQRIASVLPFKLTEAQRKVVKELFQDMKSDAPMNRLLQGDVGSGKTIVALIAMLAAMENGYQTALMVPTEILAEQHARNIKRILAKSPFRVESLFGSLKTADKKRLHQAIAAGEVNACVGTHALIQENVAFKKLGLVVIDEQHRFGVMQRAELRARGLNPEVLVMTATPIPRSLAMTVYGRPGCLDHRRDATGPDGCGNTRLWRRGAAGGEEVDRPRSARRTPGLCRLSVGRRVREDGFARRHETLRILARPRVSKVFRSAPARADEAGRKRKGDE